MRERLQKANVNVVKEINGMNLIKHSLEETPSLEIPLLILINLNDKRNVWTVGKWT